jgi:hypothetical protein
MVGPGIGGWQQALMVVVFVGVAQNLDPLPSCCREDGSRRVDLVRLAPGVDL